jgi:hypothetical protein
MDRGVQLTDESFWVGALGSSSRSSLGSMTMIFSMGVRRSTNKRGEMCVMHYGVMVQARPCGRYTQSSDRHPNTDSRFDHLSLLTEVGDCSSGGG